MHFRKKMKVTEAGFSSPLRQPQVRKDNVASPYDSASPLNSVLYSLLEIKPTSENVVALSPPKEEFAEKASENNLVPMKDDRAKKRRGNNKRSRNSSSGCGCSTSKCIKMYCECFAAGAYCTDECNCIDCKNVSSNEDTLHRLRLGITSRNPTAFSGRSRYKSGTRVHSKGCKCTRSRCQKRYCECFREGLQCSPECECVDCNNGQESFSFVPIMGDNEQIGQNNAVLAAMLDGSDINNLMDDPNFLLL